MQLHLRGESRVALPASWGLWPLAVTITTTPRAKRWEERFLQALLLGFSLPTFLYLDGRPLCTDHASLFTSHTGWPGMVAVGASGHSCSQWNRDCDLLTQFPYSDIIPDCSLIAVHPLEMDLVLQAMFKPGSDVNRKHDWTNRTHLPLGMDLQTEARRRMRETCWNPKLFLLWDCLIWAMGLFRPDKNPGLGSQFLLESAHYQSNETQECIILEQYGCSMFLTNWQTYWNGINIVSLSLAVC